MSWIHASVDNYSLCSEPIFFGQTTLKHNFHHGTILETRFYLWLSSLCHRSLGTVFWYCINRSLLANCHKKHAKHAQNAVLSEVEDNQNTVQDNQMQNTGS